MVARSPQRRKSITARKERSNEIRSHAPVRQAGQMQQQPRIFAPTPAAGAHAALHLTNEDATPGAGVLPSYTHFSGKEVDGAAG